MKWLMILFLIITSNVSANSADRNYLIRKAIEIKKFDTNSQKQKIARYTEIVYDQWIKHRKSLPNIKNPKIPLALAISESGLNPRAISAAKCIGLFQLDPKTAIYICKKYKIKYNKKNIKTQLARDVYFNTIVGLYALNDELAAANGDIRKGILSYKCGRSNIHERLVVPRRYVVLYSRYKDIYKRLA